MPSLKRPQDIAMHIANEAAMGAVFAEIGGTLGKFIGPKIGAVFGWLQSSYVSTKAFTEVIGGQLYTFPGVAGVRASFGKLAGSVASSVAGAADDVGQKVGKDAYSQVMREFNDEFVSVFHKGNLDGGSVRSFGKGLSTSMDIETVQGLERAGKVWEFKIPKNEFSKWKNEGLIQTFTDYDFKTGIINHELRFSPKLGTKLINYIVR